MLMGSVNLDQSITPHAARQWSALFAELVAGPQLKTRLLKDEGGLREKGSIMLAAFLAQTWAQKPHTAEITCSQQITSFFRPQLSSR